MHMQAIIEYEMHQGKKKKRKIMITAQCLTETNIFMSCLHSFNVNRSHFFHGIIIWLPVITRTCHNNYLEHKLVKYMLPASDKRDNWHIDYLFIVLFYHGQVTCT